MIITKAFNGDKYISNTFLTLKNAFNIETAIETGTFEGDTTAFLTQHFKTVYSIEVVEHNYNVALGRLNSLNLFPNLIHGSSDQVLKDLILKKNITNKTIFFLDAHWYDVCPLEKELEIIADCKIKPIIAIHDFVVPNSTALGYDTYHDQSFCFEWLESKFDKIYDNQYNYWYNNDVLSEGAKRGIIYLVPKNYGL